MTHRHLPSFDKYREHVRSLAQRHDGGVVYNESIQHATTVIESLLATAKHGVDILTGVLNPRVYGREEVITEARLFLASSPENRIRIILEEDSKAAREMHPLLMKLAGFKNIELRFASEDTQKLYGFHFVVTDNDNYRFEEDKTKPAAIASFGHKAGAENLRDVYSYLWDRCTELSA